MIKLTNKKYWKKGSAEVFSFLCIAPIIMSLLILVIGVAQTTSMKEKLEYATYIAGRAAVVSETMREGKAAAKEVAFANLSSYSTAIDLNSLKVNITYADGSGKAWKKGNYIKCKLSVKVNTVSPLIKGRKSCSMVMAIEKVE